MFNRHSKIKRIFLSILYEFVERAKTIEMTIHMFPSTVPNICILLYMNTNNKSGGWRGVFGERRTPRLPKPSVAVGRYLTSMVSVHPPLETPSSS